IVKAVFLKLFSNGKSLRNIVICGNISTIKIKNAHINHESYNNIHSNPAQHNNKPLPGRFAAEFPRLRRAGHLLLVHALVYHPGNFYVAAQGEPADAVNGLADFLFEKRKLDIEKKIELLYPRLKKFCGNKMPQFVEHNQ